MCSKSPNPNFDDTLQSDLKTVMDGLLDAVADMTTSGQENDADVSHRDKEQGETLSRGEKDTEQDSNVQHLDDRDGNKLDMQLSDPGVDIVDDAVSVFEYSLISMDQDLDRILRSSESTDEITMDDLVIGLLYSSSGYGSDSSNDNISSSLEDARNLDQNISSPLDDSRNLDDNISSSLEDSRNLDDNISSSLEEARNLDDDDFLPSDPSAEMIGDANEAAHLAEEIEFLERMMVFFFDAALLDEPEPEQQGAGDIGIEAEELPDLD